MKAIKIIDNLKNHSNELIKKGNLVELNNNIILLIKIFSISFAESLDPLNSFILKDIFKSLMNTMRNMRDYGYNIEANFIFLKLCEISYNKSNFEKIQKEINKSFFAINTFSYTLLEELTNIVEDVCDSSSYYKIRNKKYIALLDSILENIDEYKSPEFRRYFYTLYAKYYEFLIDNKKIEKSYINKLIYELLHNLFNNVYQFQIPYPEEIKHFIPIILNLAEKCIDNEDYINFSKLMIQYNNQVEADFDSRDEDFQTYCSLFINVIVVYLFFLFKRKGSTDYSMYLKCVSKNKFVNDEVNVMDLFISHIQHLWKTNNKAVAIISEMQNKFTEPGIFYAPELEYVLVEFYFFTSIIYNCDFGNEHIELSDDERIILNRLYKNNEFDINAKSTKEYIETFYKFTGFTKIDEKEFIRRANDFYKYVLEKK